MTRRADDWAGKVRQAIDERDRGSLEGWHRAQRGWALQRRVVLAEFDRLRHCAERHQHTLAHRGLEQTLTIDVHEPPLVRPHNNGAPVGTLMISSGAAYLMVRVSTHGQLLPRVRITDHNGRSMGADLEFAIRLWLAVSLRVKP